MPGWSQSRDLKKFKFLSNNEKERISKTNDNIYTYRYLLIGKPVLSVKAI